MATAPYSIAGKNVSSRNKLAYGNPCLRYKFARPETAD